MTVFILKLIAMGSMVIDHLGYPFFFDSLFMRSIGRLAFIIYAFLIAEGYYHLKDKPDRINAHILKIFILCLVTEIPFDLFDSGKWFNLSTQSSLLTLMLGFLALIVSGRWTGKYREQYAVSVAGSVAICLAAATASYVIKSEYKFAGVLLIVFFYLYLRRTGDQKLPIRFIGLIILFAVYIPLYIWSRAKFGGWSEIIVASKAFQPRLAGTLCSIIPLTLYNRKLGYHSKWFGWLYSIFYPLQFVVLVIARHVIRGF